MEDFKVLWVNSPEQWCGKEMKECLQAGWNGWRKVSGVMFDESFSKSERKDVQDLGETCSVVGIETVTQEKTGDSWRLKC